MVGAVFNKSRNSILKSQPVNVTVEPYDEYQSFAIVSDNAQGSLHGKFQLLQDNGTNLDFHVQRNEAILGNCTQVVVFTVVFNDTIMTELHRGADTLSSELLIEVQFLYHHFFGNGGGNEQSDIAYIQVSLDRFIGTTTSTDANPTSTENKNSTEGGDMCTGNTLEISGSSPPYDIILYNCTLNQIVFYVFTLILCYY